MGKIKHKEEAWLAEMAEPRQSWVLEQQSMVVFIRLKKADKNIQTTMGVLFVI